MFAEIEEEEEEEITTPGVYLGLTTEKPLWVPVHELDPAELIDEAEYLSEEIPCSVELPTAQDVPTNPRFSIASVSGVVSIPPSERGQDRPSVPANELFRRVWCCAEEE
jgi:hypothetical protein